MNNNHQNHQQAPKSSMWSWIFIVAIGLACLLFVLQKMGVKSVYRDESTSWVDPKVAAHDNSRPIPIYRRNKDQDAKVDAVLKNIADQFSGEVVTKHDNSIAWGVPADEARFYKKMQHKYSSQQDAKSSDDWLSLLKASYKTYRSVKSIFEHNGYEEGSSVTELLKDASKAATLYNSIETNFGISKSDVINFAAQNKNAISDWADFVEQHQASK